MGLQFVLGVLVLRWKPGYEFVKWLSLEINKFLFYSLAGASSVFGDPWFFLHPFLMLVSRRVAGELEVTSLPHASESESRRWVRGHSNPFNLSISIVLI